MGLRLAVVIVFANMAAITSGYSLAGKRALVTGSSGGIGKGIALALGELGCHVTVHYHERVEGAKDTQQRIQSECPGCFQADFREPKEIHRLIGDDVDSVWPDGFDILINNAGVVQKLALEDEDTESWQACMAVNLHAPRLLSQLSLPRMKRRGGGVIVNVSSIHGEKSNEYMGAYAASKAALDSLTRTMAVEWAPYNVRVNAIAPGVVPVERTAAAFADPNIVEAWKEKLPLRTLGTVEEVAQATLGLITNEWVTGSVWQIDGGMMARSNMPQRPRPNV